MVLKDEKFFPRLKNLFFFRFVRMIRTAEEKERKEEAAGVCNFW